MRKVCTTLPPKSDFNFAHNPKIWVHFSDEFSPDGPSETCPPLKDLPEGVPAAGENFFKKKIKMNDFLYEMCCFRCFYRYVLVENLIIS